mmetsp:Transcript_6365/g.15375  ORF Transcript_6365/g.15375 Transcript_6365/m.15375 type:complete len:376 (-) Transcript_6365:177-1304(-)|eukprot:CAMPEP_0114522692 /NCGR_PEP_ID=MMETSP0109-20121206/20878_1 /TAXON_ID=29199 /ORGANISM="Chlorarachnion reptans, Strain CCCM449" /LENGTH=375 /DNA_ID=CAMNT_0001703927 /DNA_START=69 /DNA_END=1196 /DNA_ORIENTATION=-
MQAFKTLRKKLKATRRRWAQGGSQDLRNGDEDFEELYRHYLGIENALRQFQGHVEKYCNSLQKTWEFQSTIAGDFLYFFDPDSSHRMEIETYLAKCRGIAASCKKCCESLRETVIKPVSVHIALFPTIKKIVRKRNNKRIDLISYQRQVESASSKSGPRYQKKIHKMQRAEAIFNKINDDLSQLFEDYVNYREQLLDHYIHYVIDMQVEVFNLAAVKSEDIEKIVGNLKKVPTSAPKDLQLKVEIMKKGIREFEEHMGSHPTSPTPSLSDAKNKPIEEVTRYYKNPPFDTRYPFEMRHKNYAPSAEKYEMNKLKNYEIAVYGYHARQDDELSFKPGDLIEVLEIREGGWWLGLIGSSVSRTGLFPCNYTQPHVIT